MNATSQAQQGYAAQGAAATRSERNIEYDVIARITSRLKQAITRDEYPGLLEALYENATLWRTLAIDVADPKNALPDTLRARIFYLAEFTETQTRKVIRRGDTPVPLLEVNMAILRGLKADGGAA